MSQDIELKEITLYTDLPNADRERKRPAEFPDKGATDMEKTDRKTAYIDIDARNTASDIDIEDGDIVKIERRAVEDLKVGDIVYYYVRSSLAVHVNRPQWGVIARKTATSDPKATVYMIYTPPSFYGPDNDGVYHYIEAEAKKFAVVGVAVEAFRNVDGMAWRKDMDYIRKYVRETEANKA